MPSPFSPLQLSFGRAQRAVTINPLKQLVSARGRVQSQATAAAIECQKRPARGGRNLSDRYRRLEKSARAKGALLDTLPGPSEETTIPSSGSRYPPSISRGSNAKTFRGFRIPEKPKEPEADECCMSGCAICVYDLYHDSLTTYHESLASLRASLRASQIPESEWPPSVRTSPAGENAKRHKNVSLNVFEELERAINSKEREREKRREETDDIGRQQLHETLDQRY